MRAHLPGMLPGEGCRDAGMQDASPTPPGSCPRLGQRRHRTWGGSRDPHPQRCSFKPFCRGRDAPANPLRLRPGAAGEAGPAAAHPPSQQVPPGPLPAGAGRGARGSPQQAAPPSPSPGAGPGALINYLIFPLCLIYSPARLWPYAAFVVSGSLLWQAAGAGETPPPPTPSL